MVGAAAGGGRAATVAIVLRARDMASKVFERVAKSTGGLTGAFKGLSLGIMRLLGPLGSVALGFQILTPLIAGVTVGLSTRRWLQYRDALGQVKAQMTMLGMSMGESNDMIRIINASLDKQTAISLYNNKRAITQLSQVIDKDLRVDILKLAGQMTESLGPTHDWVNLLIEAEKGSITPLKTALFGVGQNIEGLETFAEISNRIKEGLTDIEPSNVNKLADHWSAIETSITSMVGPIGDIIAALAIPFVLALELTLKGIDNIRLALGFWLEPFGLIIKFFFNLLLAAVGLMDITDVFNELSKAFGEWVDQFAAENQDLIDKLSGTFNFLVSIFDVAMDGLSLIWDETSKMFTDAWDELAVIWGFIWSDMGDIFQGFLDWIQPLWDNFTGVIEGVRDTLQTIGGLVPGLGGGDADGGVIGWLQDRIGLQRGGIVPGPIGAPVPAIVHGGERVIPVGGGGGGGGVVIVPLSIGGNMLGELIVDTIHRTAKFESGVVPGAIGGGTSALR